MTSPRSQNSAPRTLGGAPARRAFSLAEMMIALVVLGLGLLFIAAALPVGLEYTKRTVDEASATVAGRHALDVIEQNLHTSRALVGRVGTSAIARRDGIVRPRICDSNHNGIQDGTAGTPDAALTCDPVAFPQYLVADEDHEPFIKVRPFSLGNVAVVTNGPLTRGAPLIDDPEWQISQYLNYIGPELGASGRTVINAAQESDVDALGVSSAFTASATPAAAGVTRVFPPIETPVPFRIEDFFAQSQNVNLSYPRFLTRADATATSGGQILSGSTDAERLKALERRIAWTAFYRRVSYWQRTVNDFDVPPFADGDEFVTERPSDPLLYEIIVVVTRRPSDLHRFAMQQVEDIDRDTFQKPEAIEIGDISGLPDVSAIRGADRVAPTPWLVTFDGTINPPDMPTLQAGTDYDDTLQGNAADRPLDVDFSPPPNLAFKVSDEVGRLLPVGSIIIPAANDDLVNPDPDGDGILYSAAPGVPSTVPLFNSRMVGFVPHLPGQLPIYTVVERPDDNTVVVDNNGAYPWLSTTLGLDASHFPVWVIPPSYAERDSTGQPVFDRRTPIVSVQRRVVRLYEIPS